MIQKTYLPKVDGIVRNWHVVDATDKVFGRLVSNVAKVLMGKHKAIYTPQFDCGDFVVILNATKVKVTGKKLEQKSKFHHTLYPGGARFENFGELIANKPEKALKLAVKGMLPKTKLGDRFITRLKVYAGAEHIHKAQKLVNLDIK